jgi:hypothetical protein
VKAIYSIAFVTTHELGLCNGGAMIVADAAPAGRAVGSAVKSNGSGMFSPSQHPLIKSG